MSLGRAPSTARFLARLSLGIRLRLRASLIKGLLAHLQRFLCVAMATKPPPPAAILDRTDALSTRDLDSNIDFAYEAQSEMKDASGPPLNQTVNLRKRKRLGRRHSVSSNAVIRASKGES